MAATNVQTFPGDVTISSNLAVDTNTLFVDSVGNKVGIGTTNPTAGFNARTTGNSAGLGVELRSERIDNNGYYSTFKMKNIDFTTTPIFHFKAYEYLESQGNGYPIFLVEGSQGGNLLHIEQNGNVGIGKASPTTALDVAGTVTATALVGTNLYGTLSGSNAASVSSLTASGTVTATNLIRGVAEEAVRWNSQNETVFPQSATTQYHKIATLNTTGNGSNGGKIRISGTIGGFGTANNTLIDAFVGSRGSVSYGGTLNGYGGDPTGVVDIVVYLESNGTFGVWLKLLRYFTFDFTLLGAQVSNNSRELAVLPCPTTNTSVAAPTGTLQGSVVSACSIVFTGDGNVGIGTNAPTEALEVYRNGSDPTYINVVGNTSDRAGIILSEVTADKNIIMEYDGTGTGADNYLAFYSGATDWTAKGAGLNFVPSNGYVGIGTNAPSAKLHVKASGTGNPNVNGVYVFNPTSGSGDAIIAARVYGTGGDPYLSFDVTGVAGWAFGIDSSDSSKLKWSSNWDSLSAATKMTLDTSGKLGIGTDAPVSTLTVGDGVNPTSGDAVGSITLTGTGATKSAAGKPGIYHRAGVGLGLWSDAHMTMEVDGTNGILEAMYIKNDGNVGIGTNAPELKLHVNGGIYLGAETQGTAGFGSATDAANRTRTYIEFGEAGSSNDWCMLRQIGPNTNAFELSFDFHDDGNDARFSIRDILSTSTPDGITTRFRVNNSAVTIPGSLTVAGSGVSSDDRIKYNEVDIPNALNLINQLKPQKYEKLVDVSVEDKLGIWIPSDEEWESVKDDHKYVHEFGFIAQAVRNIPDMAFLVTGEETKMMTTTKTPIEYSNMTTDEQDTYTPSYVYKKKSITQEEYSILTSNVQELHTLEYFKETETQSPLSLNYNGLFVIAIGAIQELKAKNYTLETQLNSVLTRLDALENA